MRFSIAILLTAAIAAPRLRTLHAIDVAQPHTPSTNPLEEQSPLAMLRRPPPEEDNAQERSVSVDTYGELERFAKYASAADQFLCPRPLGNTLVQSVRCARLTFVCSLAHFVMVGVVL